MSSSTLARRAHPHDAMPVSVDRRRALSRRAAPTGAFARYRYDRRTGSWAWSPETYTLLGLSPGSTQPCAESLVAHHGPIDRQRTLAALEAACTEGRSFAVEARVTDPAGVSRHLVLTGEPRYESHDDVAVVEGLLIELGAVPGTADDEKVSRLQLEVAQLRTAMASRAEIEQAKGVLMLLIGCNEEVAFDTLKHVSSHLHIKVREVARAITDSASGRCGLREDIRLILRDACPPPPSAT